MSDDDGLTVICEPCANERHRKCWGTMLSRRGVMVPCACICRTVAAGADGKGAT